MRLGSFRVDMSAVTLLQKYKLKGYTTNIAAIEIISGAIETLKKYQIDNDLIAMFIRTVIGFCLEETNEQPIIDTLECGGGYSNEPFKYIENGRATFLYASFFDRQLNIPAFITHADTGAVFTDWREIVSALGAIAEAITGRKPETALQEIPNGQNFSGRIAMNFSGINNSQIIVDSPYAQITITADEENALLRYLEELADSNKNNDALQGVLQKTQKAVKERKASIDFLHGIGSALTSFGVFPPIKESPML
ncbi:hypothetical protein AGMMS49975_26150 [Clostridia bacterium]|nr:hypothetical protein AGMMS49975_26150 [Clostridia bacterium]